MPSLPVTIDPWQGPSLVRPWVEGPLTSHLYLNAAWSTLVFAVLAGGLLGAWPGYPGSFALAAAEVLGAFVISRMFARAASGQQRAEGSARQAELEMQRIFARWMRQGRSWRGGF